MSGYMSRAEGVVRKKATKKELLIFLKACHLANQSLNQLLKEAGCFRATHIDKLIQQIKNLNEYFGAIEQGLIDRGVPDHIAMQMRSGELWPDENNIQLEDVI